MSMSSTQAVSNDILSAYSMNLVFSHAIPLSALVLSGAVCSNLAWLTIWPLDVAKSQVLQAVQCALCVVQCALCVVQCALCVVQCASCAFVKT